MVPAIGNRRLALLEQEDTNAPEVSAIGGFIASPDYHGRFLP